jgi:hypothetical protein
VGDVQGSWNSSVAAPGAGRKRVSNESAAAATSFGTNWGNGPVLFDSLVRKLMSRGKGSAIQEYDTRAIATKKKIFSQHAPKLGDSWQSPSSVHRLASWDNGVDLLAVAGATGTDHRGCALNSVLCWHGPWHSRAASGKRKHQPNTAFIKFIVRATRSVFCRSLYQHSSALREDWFKRIKCCS